MQEQSVNKFIWRDAYKAYVNLDYRVDRKEAMEAELLRVGLSGVERQKAILPEEYKGDLNKVSTMLSRTRGALGCYLSQVLVMQKALEQNKDAFVFEDDLIFSTDIIARLDIIQDFLNENEWDVMWLGGTFHIDPPKWHDLGHRCNSSINCDCELGKDAELTDNPRFLRTYGCWGTYAYIVNKNSIAKILKMLDECLDMSIGIDYSFIKIQPKIKSYAFVAGSVKQYDNQSNIGDGITHFSKFQSLGAYWFTDKIEQFDPKTFDWQEADANCIPKEELRKVEVERFKDQIGEDIFNIIYDGLEKVGDATVLERASIMTVNDVINSYDTKFNNF